MNEYQTLHHLCQGYHDQRWLVGELRSDHAGETGAVWIYRGVLAVSHDPALRAFCERHLSTERQHLAIMEQLLPPPSRSWFLPLWRIAGFFLGALPALVGPRSVYVTINAVETFVETHYQQQVDRLRGEGVHGLANLLESCMAEEIVHQVEAEQLAGGPPGRFDHLIRRIVSGGSAAAVRFARLI